MAEKPDHRRVKRDHRQIGRELELFFFDETAPGAPFWLPKGMIIFKELERFIREETDRRGYEETSTPILVKSELFKQSGHWEHFGEHNMYNLDIDKELFSLKPMNCPESTLIYRFKTRSYRDLPLRLSEIGRLFRREKSGTIGGMFRVTQMTMDDAHVYCRPDQIQEEISAMLDLTLAFYKQLGLSVAFALATRPEKAMGKVEDWNEAEKHLAKALEVSKLKYKTLPKEGAFYGPKIHIDVTDSLGRTWTLATIQLDLQMPERFKLEYIDQEGRSQRPAMIHRAVFGTFERFVGILLEHFEGALPVWLSPVQAVVVPVSEKSNSYGEKVKEEIGRQAPNTRVETWIGEGTLQAKIRDAELQKVPYALVVGEREEKEKAVAVRLRDGKDLGPKKIDEVLTKIIKISENRALALW